MGRTGSTCLSRALCVKAARMAASLTRARTIQAEEKEIVLTFMSENFISFISRLSSAGNF